MVTQNDKALMRLALKRAWEYQGLCYPNPCVGAVLSDAQGNVLGVGAHHAAGQPHAEVEALKEAYLKLSGDKRILACETSAQIHHFLQIHHNNLFHSHYLHVSLEPCHHYGKTPPCSQLIYTLGIKRVVIGMADKSAHAQGGGAFLKHNGVDVLFGCLEDECQTLIEPFLAWQEKKPFAFFKLALSQNGVATGGLISSEDSRIRVHQLRNVCDLLVIGGNTVRIDRPVLDARFVQGKAPNILIYSHHKTFDKAIPLFHVEGRHVWVENSLDKIQNHHNIMVEGGQGMLDALSPFIEWYLIFQSPHKKEGKPITLPHLKKVFSMPIGEDTMSWYKRVNHG
ncbi:MAG: bifunctional diaminohydroxyphosphoribosylaminopyrimidine deaminase/5-amino-6-(5-phosphoribosylamino)uracil reductase RibD [Sulfurospirillaceae bacterium]|nr:bifunctional diaminohydroxyphosphoribosylaminopyrimidine deaminase/5-amino-6-(5-phosphoribosylamino)uracil reductase RibD [Sulfurospirillaceae bacterium]MDD2825560.1 bifunctional diaminohydroxyphosphoribosylaminopyrimidine deaminase/5-amino-6-(5-phosphoribosylamino)uracil reductase RibD [Sulfurospirillaceae bacterium]